MKKAVLIFFVGISFTLTGYAEVFKCQLPTGKVVYQSDPCHAEARIESVVKVKQMTPEEKEAAKVRLQSWQSRQAAEDAAKAESERQRQDEIQKQESLELQRRNVEAQERQAISVEQETRILNDRVPRLPLIRGDVQ